MHLMNFRQSGLDLPFRIIIMQKGQFSAVLTFFSELLVKYSTYSTCIAIWYYYTSTALRGRLRDLAKPTQRTALNYKLIIILMKSFLISF